MKKNGFITFCFSLIPGCGQMYQGYMRRGASILGWFCAIMFLSIGLYVGALTVFLVLIWAVSFFDSFNLRSLSYEQRSAFRDDFIPSSAWLREQGVGKGKLQGKSGKIFGWGCIVVGVILFYNMILDPFIWNLSNDYPMLSSVMRSIPGIVIAVGAIIFGIWLLRGGKNNNQPQNGDSFTPYEGGQNDEPQT